MPSPPALESARTEQGSAVIPLQGRCEPAARRPAPARRRPEPRPVPTRSAAHAHLDVDGLRGLRAMLSEEETRVSYWRRILQARIDLLASGASGRPDDTARLAPVLTDERVGAGRRAIGRLLPGATAFDDGLDHEQLPSLAALWDRQVEAGDTQAKQQLTEDLVAAEAQLSRYRASLHVWISEATNDLIARYRDSPDLCLRALPLADRDR